MKRFSSVANPQYFFFFLYLLDPICPLQTVFLCFVLQNGNRRFKINTIPLLMTTCYSQPPLNFSFSQSNPQFVPHQVNPSQRTSPSWPQWSPRRVASPSCFLSTTSRVSSSSDWRWDALPCSCMRTTQANPAPRTTPSSEESTSPMESTCAFYSHLVIPLKGFECSFYSCWRWACSYPRSDRFVFVEELHLSNRNQTVIFIPLGAFSF